MSLALSEIHIYPVKSLAGIRVSEATLTERGLAHDRRWMIVGPKGMLTQRTVPAMALLRTRLHENHLEVYSEGVPPLTLPLTPPSDLPATSARVWDDSVTGIPVSSEADGWFSQALNQPCTFLYMPDDCERTVAGQVSDRRQPVSFADSYPALLIGQASLDDLNTRLAEPVSMNRFRPNLVFTGGKPYEEDTWHAFRIGDTPAWAEKPCARCTLVTVDQTTARRGKEPLATLAKYRTQGNNVLFGQNLLYEPGDVIRVGDAIRVETHKPGTPRFG